MSAGVFGAMTALFVCERWGRKKSMIIGTIPQIAPSSVPQMLVGRWNGHSNCPCLAGETSQVKRRGKLVIIELIVNIAGYSFLTG